MCLRLEVAVIKEYSRAFMVCVCVCVCAGVVPHWQAMELYQKSDFVFA